MSNSNGNNIIISIDPTTDSGIQGDFITNDPNFIFDTTTPAQVQSATLYKVDETGVHFFANLSQQSTNLWTYQAPDLTDGTYIFEASILKNGTTYSPQYKIVVDTHTTESAITDNAVTIGTDGAAYINAAHIAGGTTTLSGAAEAGDTVSVVVNGTAQQATVAPDGSWTLALSGLSDGMTVSAAATATDVAGNTATSGTFAFTVDTTAPTAPEVALAHDTGSSPTDLITNNGSLALSGIETGATVQYSTDGGNTWNASFTATEGANSVEVRQTDLAGNVGQATTLAFTLDTTPPAVPVVALDHDTGSSPTDLITNNGSLALSGIETGATVQYSTDGNTWNASFTATEGANSVEVRQTDLAGNVGQATTLAFTLDTAPPAAPSVALHNDTGTSPTDGITQDGTLALGGVEANAQVEYSIDGGTTWKTGFSAVEGSNSVEVRQTDLAGNVSAASGPFNVTLDTTPPTGAIKIDHTGNSSIVTVSGTIADNIYVASLTLSQNGGTPLSVAVDSAGQWSVQEPLTAGQNTFVAEATDKAGNITDFNAAITYDPTHFSDIKYVDAANHGKNGYISWGATGTIQSYEYWIDGDTHYKTTDTHSIVYGTAALNSHQFHLIGFDATGNQISFAGLVNPAHADYSSFA
jgi:large repetitive protein